MYVNCNYASVLLFKIVLCFSCGKRVTEMNALAGSSSLTRSVPLWRNSLLVDWSAENKQYWKCKSMLSRKVLGSLNVYAQQPDDLSAN